MQDFPAFETVEGRTDLGLLILADHATNRLPPKYGDLGLDPSAFERHIAYDIGIEPLIRLSVTRGTDQLPEDNWLTDEVALDEAIRAALGPEATFERIG